MGSFAQGGGRDINDRVALRLPQKGVLNPAIDVPCEAFMTELSQRGIEMTVDVS